jgi:hypothetical protein
MYAYGETYTSAMQIPVPIRKWLIERWNKQKEKEQSDKPGSDITKPLTPQERIKMIETAQQTQNAPRPPSELLTSRR